MNGNITPRAWDDVLEEMLYSKIEQFDDSLMFRFDQHFETETPIYMWPTGLKDKNGVEIYGGDILRTEVQIRVDSFFSFTEPVIWNDQLACFDFPGSSIHGIGFGAISDEYTKAEIIGNIYTHPHLINDTEVEK